MNLTTVLRLFLSFGVLVFSCVSPGQTFTNLDFESANVPVLPPGQSGGFVPVSDALPGWQLFFGFASNAPFPNIRHNDVTLGTISASILGPRFLSSESFPVRIIDGRFMPFLQPGFAGFPSDPGASTVTIAQTGLVPDSAQSLQFKTTGIFGGSGGNFGVFLNGQNLSLTPLETTNSYTLYGAPIAGFAGQIAELRFSAFGSVNNIGVDSFQFLSTAVPEPSTWALLVLGSALFWCAARRRRK